MPAIDQDDFFKKRAAGLIPAGGTLEEPRRGELLALPSHPSRMTADERKERLDDLLNAYWDHPHDVAIVRVISSLTGGANFRTAMDAAAHARWTRDPRINHEASDEHSYRLLMQRAENLMAVYSKNLEGVIGTDPAAKMKAPERFAELSKLVHELNEHHENPLYLDRIAELAGKTSVTAWEVANQQLQLFEAVWQEVRL